MRRKIIVSENADQHQHQNILQPAQKIQGVWLRDVPVDPKRETFARRAVIAVPDAAGYFASVFAERDGLTCEREARCLGGAIRRTRARR